jgi:hypothetical protein
VWQVEEDVAGWGSDLALLEQDVGALDCLATGFVVLCSVLLYYF